MNFKINQKKIIFSIIFGLISIYLLMTSCFSNCQYYILKTGLDFIIGFVFMYIILSLIQKKK